MRGRNGGRTWAGLAGGTGAAVLSIAAWSHTGTVREQLHMRETFRYRKSVLNQPVFAVMVERIERPLWGGGKIQIQYENMVGKLETGVRLDIDGLVSKGAIYDIRANGARFEIDKISVKVFQSGTMIAYGAHSRLTMRKAFKRVLDIIGISGDLDGMTVFLVVAKTNLPFKIDSKIMPAIKERLKDDYMVVYDTNMPFPGIWLNRGSDTVKRIMARVYASGVINCEARTEEIVREATLDIYAKVLAVKNQVK